MKIKSIKKHVPGVVGRSTMTETSLAGMNIISNAFSCPLKLKMCHPICYWYKKGHCIFPAEGYDERGRIIRKR